MSRPLSPSLCRSPCPSVVFNAKFWLHSNCRARYRFPRKLLTSFKICIFPQPGVVRSSFRCAISTRCVFFLCIVFGVFPISVLSIHSIHRPRLISEAKIKWPIITRQSGWPWSFPLPWLARTFPAHKKSAPRTPWQSSDSLAVAPNSWPVSGQTPQVRHAPLLLARLFAISSFLGYFFYKKQFLKRPRDSASVRRRSSAPPPARTWRWRVSTTTPVDPRLSAWAGPGSSTIPTRARCCAHWTPRWRGAVFGSLRRSPTPEWPHWP